MPRGDSSLSQNIIFWERFPAEKPEIVYTMQEDYTLYLIIGIIIIAAVVAVVLLMKFKGKTDLNKREAEINEQIKQTKYQFMKRQMDEKMFRSLMEKHMKELGEVQAKKRMRK